MTILPYDSRRIYAQIARNIDAVIERHGVPQEGSVAQERAPAEIDRIITEIRERNAALWTRVPRMRRSLLRVASSLDVGDAANDED